MVGLVGHDHNAVFPAKDTAMNHVKTLPVLLLLAAGLAAGTARADFKDLLKGYLEAKQPAPAAQPATAVAAATAVLSQDEIVAGLKEALAKGAQGAVAKLGKEGGFMTNAAVKIPMPADLARIDKTLRQFGQGKYADQFVATMNQAAEKAVPEASAILAESIRAMTLEDAQAILKGPDDAATQYFRKQGEARLMERFKPMVAEATDRAGVTSAYKKMVKKAGPLSSLLGADATDLDAYVAARSLDGLFKMVAEEEKAIRHDPVARGTDLLKKVFGGLAK